MTRNMMFKISGNSVKSAHVGRPCSREEEHPLTIALQVTHSRQFYWIPLVPCRLQSLVKGTSRLVETTSHLVNTVMCRFGRRFKAQLFQ